MQKIIAHLILGLAATFFLGGCTNKKSQSNPENTVNTSSEKSFLIMGTSSDYPPYEFLQSDGKIVGLDIDVAESIANHLGKQLIIQDMDFSGLIPALKAGRIDVIFAGLTMTPERAAKLDFTVAYFCPPATSLGLLYRKDAPIMSLKALSGKRVGVQLGSAMEQVLIADQANLPGVEVLSLGRNNQLVEELKIGRIDAVLLDGPQASAFAQTNQSLSFALMNSPNTPGLHAAVEKGSPLLPDLNAAIDALMASGELEAIAHKWFKPHVIEAVQSQSGVPNS